MEFPVDLVTSILLRLPVKSILRFKCVAKTWCDLFQNPTFISQHHSISKKNSRLVVYSRCHGEEKFVVRLFDDQTLVSYHDLHHQFPHLFADKSICSFYIHGGFVCLSQYCGNDFSITLWNPATRDLRTLPDCNEYVPHKKQSFMHHLGFGFDPLSNDYKLIYIRRFSLWDFNSKNQYAVYRMSTDSWRELDQEEVEFLDGRWLVIPNTHNTCANGVCYWRVVTGLPGSSLKIMILSFHLGTEVFQLMHAPPLPAKNGNLLSLHEDRISFWDTGGWERKDRSYGVWVLNDEGNWTKLMNFDHVLQVERMSGLWKNGKVFVESLSGELLLYDLDTGEFRELGIRGNGKLQVYAYAESLVSIGRD